MLLTTSRNAQSVQSSSRSGATYLAWQRCLLENYLAAREVLITTVLAPAAVVAAQQPPCPDAAGTGTFELPDRLGPASPLVSPTSGAGRERRLIHSKAERVRPLEGVLCTTIKYPADSTTDFVLIALRQVNNEGEEMNKPSAIWVCLSACALCLSTHILDAQGESSPSQPNRRSLERGQS